MDNLADGYYFMFEIGWFLDLLIPTIVRVEGGSIYLVGSKPCEANDLKPCCVPAGGEKECKKLSLNDPSLKAFKSIDSLVAIRDTGNLKEELEKSLGAKEISEKYLNTKAKKQREAVIERVESDYQVLSNISL